MIVTIKYNSNVFYLENVELIYFFSGDYYVRFKNGQERCYENARLLRIEE